MKSSKEARTAQLKQEAERKVMSSCTFAPSLTKKAQQLSQQSWALNLPPLQWNKLSLPSPQPHVPTNRRQNSYFHAAESDNRGQRAGRTARKGVKRLHILTRHICHNQKEYWHFRQGSTSIGDGCVRQIARMAETSPSEEWRQKKTHAGTWVSWTLTDDDYSCAEQQSI